MIKRLYSKYIKNSVNGLILVYCCLLIFAFFGKISLAFSVVSSTLFLFFWILNSTNKPREVFKNNRNYFLGLFFYFLGAPFFINFENGKSVTIGIGLFFISRIFFFLQFEKYCKPKGLKLKNYLAIFLPFIFSLVFSNFFLVPILPGEIIFFVVTLTFSDALFLSFSFFFNVEGKTKTLFILSIFTFFLMDHLGCFFVYAGFANFYLIMARGLSALVKLLLTLVVFNLEKVTT